MRAELALLRGVAIVLILAAPHADAQPAYVREGDRVEQQFRSFRDRLDQFYRSLRAIVESEAPDLLREIEDAPPEPVIYGYQLLPQIADPSLSAPAAPVASFNYSWPVTGRYIENENVRLARAQTDLREAADAPDSARRTLFATLIRDYRDIVKNQRTIDQYIQYNRFWQRSIAEDRARFDQLTRLYELMKSGSPAASEAVREVLGRPEVPSFVKAISSAPDRVLLRVRLYTDIEDDGFLGAAKTAIEEMWRASEAGVQYAVEIDLHRAPASQLYEAGNIPARGEHVDLRRHAARFPGDGAVLTTGAESTHSFVGRYVALGSGDLSRRTLAHEFGHLLGFRDGYIRGYRDLGDEGFEILELTSSFDDIMTSPRQGRVQAAHFKLILDALP